MITIIITVKLNDLVIDLGNSFSNGLGSRFQIFEMKIENIMRYSKILYHFAKIVKMKFRCSRKSAFKSLLVIYFCQTTRRMFNIFNTMIFLRLNRLP